MVILGAEGGRGQGVRGIEVLAGQLDTDAKHEDENWYFSVKRTCFHHCHR